MNKVIVVILALLTIGFASCEEDGAKPCTEDVTTASVLSDFPDSLKVGTTQTVSIQYVLENSCGEFDHFNVTNTDKTFEVEMITKYEGCNCNLEFSEESIDFDINIDFPGIYEYSFWLADGDYDTRSIKIFE